MNTINVNINNNLEMAGLSGIILYLHGTLSISDYKRIAIAIANDYPHTVSNFKYIVENLYLILAGDCWSGFIEKKKA